jgi:hypothetical protein
MVELIIKNPDGSVYFRMFFNSVAEKNAWLKEEQTRPYWKSDFQLEVINTIKEEQAKRDAIKKEFDDREEARKALKVILKDLKKSPPKTVADVNQVLLAIVDWLEVK